MTYVLVDEAKQDDSEDSDDEMPDLEGADPVNTAGMTEEQISKAKQTRYKFFCEITLLEKCLGAVHKRRPQAFANF